jgi:tRNA dimethylallyltransferase
VGGEFVEGFGGDYGAVHVRQQQAFGAAGGGLEDGVYGGGLQGGGYGFGGGGDGEGEVGGFFGGEPGGVFGAEGSGDAAQGLGGQRGGWGRDQGEGMHGGGPCGGRAGVTRRVVIVTGPTCSGKSALALMLAELLGGVVINADAMQCYADLAVLTARPSAADMGRAPHALYGVADGAEAVSVAWWREAALGVIGGRSLLPILCGGSLMYLDALLHGLAAVPDPGEAARAEARGLLAAMGSAGLHGKLAEVDPVTAGRVRPSDGQRVARAYEVWRGTGRGLVSWQEAGRAGAGFDCRAVVLMPDRAVLRGAIAGRWEAMMDGGAIAEVDALCARGLDPALPVMRAHGVPELSAWRRGEMGLDEAGRRAKLATGQYTKRQATWLRHHRLGEVYTIDARWDAKSQHSVHHMAPMMEFLSSEG